MILACKNIYPNILVQNHWFAHRFFAQTRRSVLQDTIQLSGANSFAFDLGPLRKCLNLWWSVFCALLSWIFMIFNYRKARPCVSQSLSGWLLHKTLQHILIAMPDGVTGVPQNNKSTKIVCLGQRPFIEHPRKIESKGLNKVCFICEGYVWVHLGSDQFRWFPTLWAEE